MKHISPKHIQRARRDQEPINTHPESIRKRHKRERDDEVGEQRRDEHDEGFGGYEVEEEPEDVGEEGGAAGPEIDEPVGY